MFVANRSEEPLYVDVSDSFAGMTVKKIEEGKHPPLSDTIVFGGVENNSLSIGLKPYSVAFVIF